jgi:plasmid maintenance system killer protein
VEVFFRNRKLQKQCNSENEMLCAFGKKRAEKLKTRLAELRAVANLALIPSTPPSRCHELSGNRQGQLSVDLDHPFRLVFIPANEPVPTKPDGGLDWRRVTAVEVVEIVDPH